MPVTFNIDTNSYEGEILTGTSLPRFDFSVFDGLITNNADIAGAVSANSDANIEITNTPNGTISRAAGSPFTVDLMGNGARTLTNDGLRYGPLYMGAGNDVLINRIVASGGADTTCTITGTEDMGDGDDLIYSGPGPDLIEGRDGFDDILAHAELSGGNAAIDLSALLDAFSVYRPNPENGSVLTINNVAEGDLTQASFSMIDYVITIKEDLLSIF